MISSFAASDPAAIRANSAEYRTKYLGVTNPAPTGSIVPNDPNTGGYENPAVRANPQVTANPAVGSVTLPTTPADLAEVVAVPGSPSTTVVVPQGMASSSSATITQSRAVTVAVAPSRLLVPSPADAGFANIRVVRNASGRIVVTNQ
jgi:hypothetical protein